VAARACADAAISQRFDENIIKLEIRRLGSVLNEKADDVMRLVFSIFWRHI
jgi:hypothetical protein